jgi:hypothetical protein
MAEKTEALGGAGLLVLNFSLLMMAFISQNSPLAHMIPEW